MQTVINQNLITVIIADDHSVFRSGLVTFLADDPRIHVIGQAANGEELINLVSRLKPKIVISDIDMPVMNGIEASTYINQHFPEVGIIAISLPEKTYYIRDMLKAGARGYLTKDVEKAEIIHAIHKVHENDQYICPKVVSEMIEYISDRKQERINLETVPELTEKELSVIRLMCKQYSNKEIADKLDTSVRAVESAKERILKKTKARNMIGVIFFALKNSIIVIDQF